MVITHFVTSQLTVIAATFHTNGRANLQEQLEQSKVYFLELD